MKTALYLTPYLEKNLERRAEIEKSIERNFKAGFDEIILMVEEKDLQYAQYLFSEFGLLNPYVAIEVASGRPAFQKYIDNSNRYNTGWLNMVCNSDVSIDAENLQKIKDLPWDKKLFVALSRYDETPLGTLILLDRPDSADMWAWQSPCDINNVNCPCGFCGVDNSLAWKAQESNYQVVNPSRDVVTRHLHNVKVYNYRENSQVDGAVKASQICPEPYAFHNPIRISEII